MPPAADKRCRIMLAATPESTRKARDFTAATLERWDLKALIQDAVMIASELVTNAISHASDVTVESADYRGVGLTWQFTPGCLVCVVTDHSSRPPVLVMPGPDAESGHGLQIVHALSAGWGWAMLGPAEKAVWAALVSEP
ncbi:MAG TPA: ATP-binding protein [Streptosporangiaceae bacterium]|jgi:anti-sigma regulatory factor (Ser/Thr protein kinase)